MRVFISGVSCSGKTTLLRDLKNALGDPNKIFCAKVKWTEELARKFFEDHNLGHDTYESLLSNYDDSMKYWSMLINEFKKQIMYDGNCLGQLIFYDRGPTDYLINATMNYYAGTPEQMSQYRADYLAMKEAIYNLPLREDDLIFMTNPHNVLSTEVESDGFRPVGVLHRRPIEKVMFELVYDNNDKIIKLPYDQSERINMIITEVLKRNYRLKKG